MDTPHALSLEGLTLLPSQALGAFRVVPVRREEVREDIRLGAVESNAYGVVKLSGAFTDPGYAYAAYVPNALVMTWGEEAGALLGGALGQVEKKFKPKSGAPFLIDRMVKREHARALRFLPLHTAMEGFLALEFGGPSIAWREYSHAALKVGLAPRFESTVPASLLARYREALAMFEIAEGQVGALVFCQDALVSAFVVSHPHDYKQLHWSLLTDFVCDQIYQYALIRSDAPPMEVALDAEGVRTLDDLARALARGVEALGAQVGYMADPVFQAPLDFKPLYTLQDFTLYRFMSDLKAHSDNHIGEAIIDARGRVQYLKTYRLSVAQAKRGYLLKQLGAHDWHLARTAQALGATTPELISRLQSAGFGHLLDPSATTHG